MNAHNREPAFAKKPGLVSASIYHLYTTPLVKPDQVVFRINGHEGRVILMDEIAERSVERHRLNFYSQTDLMYSFIVRNPNCIITLDEVREKIDRRFLSLTFTDVLSGLKFTGKLKQLFFRASKSHLIFHNPVNMARMKSLGIAYEEIIPYMVMAPKRKSKEVLAKIALVRNQ